MITDIQASVASTKLPELAALCANTAVCDAQQPRIDPAHFVFLSGAKGNGLTDTSEQEI